MCKNNKQKRNGRLDYKLPSKKKFFNATTFYLGENMFVSLHNSFFKVRKNDKCQSLICYWNKKTRLSLQKIVNQKRCEYISSHQIFGA